MSWMDELRREIEGLEAQLEPGATTRELAQIRRGLAQGGKYAPAITLPNLKIGFACKERWDDMVGDERVRACAGCDRPVFNLSEMTRAEAERVLATRGLTPCVRFYRRPDGTIMTADCPTGEKRERRHLAVVATSIAAGATLASPAARADDTPPADGVTVIPADPPVIDPTVEQGQGITIDHDYIQGLPVPTRTFEGVMGVPQEPPHEMGIMIIEEPRERPALEWSLWGRLGVGITSPHATVLARGLTPPEQQPSTLFEAALGTDLTLGVAAHGKYRLGAWGEIRTTSAAVIGGELVIEGLPPHPYSSAIRGAGSIVLRAGGNSHVFTTALGFGYVGSYRHDDPWIPWLGHVVGGRIVASMNHSLDDPREWSVTFGLEVEPLGLAHAVLDLVKGDD